MSSAQCRAARGFLDWTQFELAEVSRLNSATVRDFEAEQRKPRQASLRVMRAALESADVVFLDENGEGPGVKMKSNSSAQCRAARGLLGWTHSDVAAASGVSDKTVRRLESEQGTPRRASLKVIRRVFERAGVIFVGNDEDGVCVRLEKPK
jgi:transcriptional regulator with XRE-family HTH domain